MEMKGYWKRKRVRFEEGLGIREGKGRKGENRNGNNIVGELYLKKFEEKEVKGKKGIKVVMRRKN